MSRFVEFTCNGDPRLVNVEKIHIIDQELKSKKVMIFLSDCTEPWTVDQSYEEVRHAVLMACDGVLTIIKSKYIDGVCQNCGAYIPTDHQMDCIDEEDVHHCYWCGAAMKTSVNKTGL